MRYLYVLLLIFGIALLLIFSQSDELSWVSYDKAVEESKNSGKKIFLFISSPTCPKCAEFKDFFLKNKEAYKWISTNFIPVHIPDPARAPVSVEIVPRFCIGYPGNFSCFYATSGKELLTILENYR
ncbi:MAG: thioredoxin family protein [Archaeoglobaceae archaeon]